MSSSKNHPIHKQCSFSTAGGVDAAGCEPAIRIKHHLHNFFELIDKDVDLLISENLSLKERVEALEEILVNSGHSIQTDQPISAKLPPQQKHHPQQFSVSSVKRDSMVAASQLSQKIKSTYKLKTSSKIFKGQSNTSSHLVATYEWHKDGIWYITSSQKKGRQYIATASADSTVNICDVTKMDYNLTPIVTYTGHQSSVNCVKFHSTNDLMLTASGDGAAQVWRFNPESIQRDYDGESGSDEPVTIKSPLLEMTDHHNVVVSCDWMSGADQCVTASWDHMANIYDYHTGDLVVQLIGHDQPLTDVCAHESTRLIVTSSHDTTFRLWDFRDAIHSVSVFQGHSRTVTSTCFMGADKIISGGDDRNVKVWDLKNMRSPLMTISMESGINKLSASQQHNLITIPLDNRNVRIYDINGNRICRLSRDSHSRMVTCAAWLPGGAGSGGGGPQSTGTGGTFDSGSVTGTANVSSSSTSVAGSAANVSNPGSNMILSPSSGNSLTLFTCAFDRRVCAWNIVIEK